MKTFKSYTHICKHCIHDIKEDNKFVIDDYALLCKIIDKSNTTVVIKRVFIDLKPVKIFNKNLKISWFEFNKYYKPLTVNDCEVLKQIAKL